MKKFILVSVFAFFGFLVISASFAQTPLPAASVAPAVVAPAPAPSVFDFIKAHVSQIALVVYGVLDLLILASPKLDANGLLHQLLLWAGKLSGQTPPPAA